MTESRDTGKIPPVSRAQDASSVIANRSRTRRILLTFFIILIAAALVVGYGAYWIADRFFAPVYQRSCAITRVAWGKDGSLYMEMLWGVSILPNFINPMAHPAENVPLADGGHLVYRLDPRDRMLHKLHIEEGQRLRARWPVTGWVGGRYIVANTMFFDTATGHYQTRTDLFDQTTGETVAFNVGVIMGISPDDRYMLVSDSRGLPVVHWMDTGKDVPVPDTVINFYDYVRADHYVIRVTLASGDTRIVQNHERLACPRAFRVTDTGILDVDQSWIIDPVTFDTRAGWYVANAIGGSGQEGPDGLSGSILGPGGLSMGFPRYGISIIWSGPPAETTKWRLPESWRDLSTFPEAISVPFTGAVPS